MEAKTTSRTSSKQSLILDIDEDKRQNAFPVNVESMPRTKRKICHEVIENVSHLTKNNLSLQKRRKCALIIDDSTTIRKVFHRALSNLGYEVYQAENGLKGLEELKITIYDVVLCDFLMPIMDGVDCVQQYRAWEQTNRQWANQVGFYFLSCYISEF